MLPTTRRMGGIAHPRDLHLVGKGSHLERQNVNLPPLISPVVHRQSLSHVDTSCAARSPFRPLSAPLQIRSFHSSSSAPYDSTSYNVTDVPEFFSKYKERRATSLGIDSEIHHEELGLMQPLTHSIRMGDVVATIRRLRSKVPIEHRIAGGHVVHPSGFVVPGPGHTCTSDAARAKERERNESLDLAIQTAAVARRVLESDFKKVNATTLPTTHKIPFEVRESDGTIKHPSGFVPPTPAHKFRHAVSTNMFWDRKVPVPRSVPRQPSPARAVLRAMHTASADAS